MKIDWVEVYVASDKDGLGFMHQFCAEQLCDGENGCTKVSQTLVKIRYRRIGEAEKLCLWCGHGLKEKCQA